VPHAEGSVTMQLTRDNEVKVHITAKGLPNGLPHAMHIHSGKLGQCPPPSAATEHNGHLVITTQDGGAFYGPPVTSLTEAPGGTTPKQLLDYKHYPSDVPIDYTRKFNLGPVVAAQIRDNLGAVVVIHGIDYNHNDRYDHVLSIDTEHRKKPIEQTAPALCGPLKAEPQQTAQAASGTRVFTAALGPADSGPADTGPSSLALLCDLRSAAGRLL
jgi:hypothetical protein